MSSAGAGNGSMRRGAVLLEVLVAFALLAIGALAIMNLASESVRTVDHIHKADAALARASGFVDAVALWPRTDLDRHLGDHQQGPWRLRVDRVAPTLYEVILTDSTRSRALLTTTLYRSEDAASAQR